MLFKSMLRIILLGTLVIVPACGGSTPGVILGWQAPASLLDQSYPNGHPLVVNTGPWAALEDSNFAAVNVYRANLGLPALARDVAGDGLGRAYSQHMTIEPFFDHLDPEGDYLDGRALKASGFYPYVKVRENIEFTGDPTPAAVMALFLASPEHKGNLEAVDVNSMGIGIYYDSTLFKYFITEEFFYR